MLERPLYLPYRKNGRVVIPFNRSCVLGPGEKRKLILSIFFPPGTLLTVEDGITASQVRFSPQTNGTRIWGILENCSAVPRHLTHRMVLCLIRSTATHLKIADEGLLPIEERQGPVALNTASSSVVQDLISSFPELCKPSLGRCRTYEVTSIPFKCPLPRQQRPYQSATSPREQSLVLKEVEKLVELGAVTEVTTEPFCIPVFAIPKKTGDVRLVMDFRKFNTCVEQQPFLPVNRDHSMATIRPYAVGSALDLSNAYFQVALHPSLHRYFGISVAGRFFQYRRLPFGYHNSPAEFLRALRPTLQRIRRQISSQLLDYMDDLLLLSPSEEQHKSDLRVMFQILQEDGWRLRLDKCIFMQQNFPFLGHIVTPKGWRPSPSLIDRLQAVPCPSTRSGWRSVRGWFQQIIRFLYHGDDVHEALRKAEKTGSPEDWCMFLRGLENHMIRIMHPLGDDEFGLAVDASASGWGACLTQGRHIICCTSGLWSKRYSHHVSNNLELEAVVRALKRFRPWLFAAKVTLFTDNSSVQSLANSSNQSDFIKRRLDKILDICPKILFLPGKTNILPDFLSRQSELVKVGKGETAVVMASSTEDVLREAHAAHYGTEKTYLIARRIDPSIDKRQVEDFVRKCQVCQQFKARVPSVDLGHLPDAQRVGELLSMDFIGPLKSAQSGMRYIFTLVDSLSRLRFAIPCMKPNIENAKKGIGKWIERYGYPSRILSDRGAAFQSAKFRQWAADLGVQIILTAPHAHHSNGLCERFQQTLINRLRRMMLSGEKKRSWKDVLPEAIERMNRAPHGVTGFDPAYLYSGKYSDGSQSSESRLEADRKLAKARMTKQRENMCRKGRRGTPFIPTVGQRVWVYDSVRMSRLDDKFSPFWIGPFEVIEALSGHIFWVREIDTGQRLIVHLDNLRPHFS